MGSAVTYLWLLLSSVQVAATRRLAIMTAPRMTFPGPKQISGFFPRGDTELENVCVFQFISVIIYIERTFCLSCVLLLLLLSRFSRV